MIANLNLAATSAFFPELIISAGIIISEFWGFKEGFKAGDGFALALYELLPINYLNAPHIGAGSPIEVSP